MQVQIKRTVLYLHATSLHQISGIVSRDKMNWKERCERTCKKKHCFNIYLRDIRTQTIIYSYL